MSAAAAQWEWAILLLLILGLAVAELVWGLILATDRRIADQTMELVPSLSSRNASVPVRRKRCHAVLSCARAVATLATMAVC